MNVKKAEKTFWICDFFIFLRHCIFLVKRYTKLVCERGTICQWKIFNLGLFLSKLVFKRARSWIGEKSLRIRLC